MTERLEHWLAQLPPDYGTDPEGKKALLVGIESAQCHGEELTLELDELVLLLSNLGVETLGRMTFSRPKPDVRGFFGQGQRQKIKDQLDELGANLLVSNDTLTALQTTTLREETLCDVWDRPLVITQIFERRASSAESKAQLGLVSLRSQLPSLRGLGQQMSRSGAGIGTRGSGETEYERHRRKLSRQERVLSSKIKDSAKAREQRRISRQKKGLETFALVGYTNSGKTTLLSSLTGDKSIVGENKLFATLDPKTRRLVWPDGKVALVTDTVGFLRRLPPQLEASFRATLEEIKEATALVLVLDAHDPTIDHTCQVVLDTLEALGTEELPLVLVLNKIDTMSPERVESLKAHFERAHERVFALSAQTGEGVEELKSYLWTLVKGEGTWQKA